jgi:hypothetical protein
VYSHEEKQSHGAKSGYTASSRGQLIIRPSTTLRKAVMELVAAWSADQSGWKKQHFIQPLFKLKNSGEVSFVPFLIC